MTPTEQDIEFFREAKRIQELWEPKESDWVKTRYNGIQVLKADDGSRYLVWHIGRTYPDLEMEMYLSGGDAEKIKEECLWLPRQGQLQAMLEERGYSGELHFGLPTQMGDEAEMYSVEIWRRHIPLERYGQSHIEIEAIGPTPSIALGRALIEVLANG